MSHRVSDGTRVNQWGKPGSMTGVTGSGSKEKPRIGKPRPSHKIITRRRQPTGDRESQRYDAPVLSNPGTLIDITVGGGHLGSKLAHENEAPFPEKLAAYFIKSLCPPGGTVLDPFSGSGTTSAAALKNGRNTIATDLRSSQVDLTKRRIREAMDTLKK